MVEGVPREFEFSFLVGEVVRHDVYVETEARLLWAVLEAGGIVSGDPQNQFGRLLPQLRKAVAVSSVTSAFRDLAVSVLQVAQDAHKERNRLVHDQWIQVPWSPDEVRDIRRPDVRRQLSELRALSKKLLDLIWRMRGLTIIAPAWLGQEHDEDADDLHQWTRVAMGHIDYDGQQVKGTEGPAVLPPLR